ncbi:hypothetical protein G7054_g1299 [Neopestalotiopsis clavispora]|nr:hypothetical protein G7054_g1299 [Neopestalotiopsis clavispora]
MAVEVEDLLVQPFRELIKRGNEAITNGEATRLENPELSQVMLRSARAVVREGERALQKVQPLLLDHLERHGDAFRDAFKNCDEVFESQRQLEDVLYDIDDYIEVETFDATKFSQLQAASKVFALSTIDNIRRLKIGDAALPSPAAFPPLPAIPRRRPSKVEPLIITSRPATRTGHYSTDQTVYTPQATSAPLINHSRRALSTSIRSSPGEAHMLRRMSSKTSQKSQKSLAPSTSSSDSQYSQASFQWSGAGQSDTRGYNSQQPSDVEILGDEIQNLLSEPNSPKLRENRQTTSEVSTPWTSAWVHDQLSSPRDLMAQETIPEDSPIGRFSEESTDSARTKRYTVESDTLATDVVFPTPRISQASKTRRASMLSSVNNASSYAGLSTSAPTGDMRTSLPVQQHSQETLVQGMEPYSPTKVSNNGSLHGSHGSMSNVSHISHGSIGSENLPPEFFQRQIWRPSIPSCGSVKDLSLEQPRSAPKPPVYRPPRITPHAGDEEHPKPVWYSREENCSIGPDSTLYQMKSFCEGALAFKNGRYQEATKTAMFIDSVVPTSAVYHDSMSDIALSLGTNQAISFGPRKTVTQCINCEYSHSAAEFRRDMAKDKRANATTEGVNYRLRFLYKSHLAAESKGNVLYGCIFCAHLGYTSREGDATVFTTERQLFRHLSHHPQPLPQIPGLTVLYGYLGNNCSEAEDYDLHFPSPQFASPIIPEAPLLTRRPTAVAVQPQLQKEGSRPVTDPDGRRDVLQFLAGARIVGVEFPDAWGGKWCTGWHDGIRGAFPAKLVQVEAPPKSDIRLPGTNNDGLVVVSRWKWESRDVSAGWLTFDKNTTITNVSWLSYDSWCWSGMTKDGKVGFFPSSHIKPDSIRDPNGLGNKKDPSRRLFKMRHAKSTSSSGSS